ncbi:MAG TPA: 3'-5' exonuclease [Elusimicrobiota bacterium]|nr:3'-5' exonuclease [Elusimicrobiota bacterium]
MGRPSLAASRARAALKPRPNFVAIDFETADYGPDSACAVGLVRVENGAIARKKHYYIRPPRQDFAFTHIHGISWEDVLDKPSFAELWPELKEEISGAEFLAAHNSRFDQGVLNACCQSAGVAAPKAPFVCTVSLARKTWGIYPTKLPDVCRFLGLSLNHHEALSDAEACARIVLAASSA